MKLRGGLKTLVRTSEGPLFCSFFVHFVSDLIWLWSRSRMYLASTYNARQKQRVLVWGSSGLRRLKFDIEIEITTLTFVRSCK